MVDKKRLPLGRQHFFERSAFVLLVPVIPVKVSRKATNAHFKPPFIRQGHFLTYFRQCCMMDTFARMMKHSLSVEFFIRTSTTNYSIRDQQNNFILSMKPDRMMLFWQGVCHWPKVPKVPAFLRGNKWKNVEKRWNFWHFWHCGKE